MTETEWLTCGDPLPMLMCLPGKADKRKLRLLSVACCRKVWDSLHDDSRRIATRQWQKRVRAFAGRQFDPFTALESAERAVEVGENFADGLVGEPELREVHGLADGGYFAADSVLNLIVNERLPRDGVNRTEREIFASMLTGIATVLHLRKLDFNEALQYRANTDSDLTMQSHLFRDIFGNPFRKIRINRKWLISTVLLLAQQMYDSRDFSPMPILADALQDAGCDNDDILDHCRGNGPHVRGCWVVDLLLGRT